MRLMAILITALLTLATPALARDAAPPKATIADAAWLAGRWTGEGMGGQVQEALSDPVNGQMVGYFTLSWDGKTAGLTPLKWSIPYVGPMTILDGWNDGKEAPQARRDRRQAAAG